MTTPTGCEALPVLPAATAPILPGTENPASDDSSGSFESLLAAADPEPAPETGEEPGGPQALPEETLPLLGLFTPPFTLFAASPPAPAAPENNLPVTGEAIPGELAQIATKPPVLPGFSAGTSAAQEPPMVFTGSDAEEGAAAAQENMPLAVEYHDSPAFETTFHVERVEAEEPKARETKELLPLPDFVPADSAEFEIAETAPVEGTQINPVKSIEAIDNQVQLLRASGQDRLEVIIRPDGVTQLHLQITRTDGQIQVQARCDRADFMNLDPHWATIQSTLAAQGIKVEALQPASSWDSEFSHQGQGSPRRDEREGRMPVEFLFEQDAPAKTPAGRGARSSGSNRGWQRWA